MSEDRIADYFLIVGLPENPEPLETIAGETPAPKPEPITDICVIIPSDGEECPPGYKSVLHTPSQLNADLNSGSLRSNVLILCYRRGRDKPPLTDIGILYDGREKVLGGCEIVDTTPYGRSANLNNAANFNIYLTYRRAAVTAGSDTLAVTDICVIITNKGEITPHSYNRIDKNLNKSAIIGNNVYICYKKSMCKDFSLSYKPAVLSRYPTWDWKDFPLPEAGVAEFALPMGAALESWLTTAEPTKPVLSTFVLTGEYGTKMYGAAVLFYEPYPLHKLTEEQKKDLNLHAKVKKRNVHASKAICLLARKPFFNGFSKFLNYLYRMTLRQHPHELAIEHHVDYMLWNVPFPTPEKPIVRLDILDGTECYFNILNQNPIPISGASFSLLLRNLQVDTTLNLLTYVLLENKLVVHSLRPSVLTKVIEAVGSMIFPFQWQCPYIPLCPLTLSEILLAPCPYIIGVDSRYFDLFVPPTDVLCVDIDTNSIHAPQDKLNMYNKLLPKRPLKVLKATLEKLIERIHQHDGESLRPETQAAREQAIELAIQEAFLRFMAAILKGYKNFLLPLTGLPTQNSTDIKERFDLQGFLKSRDKAYHKLYHQLMRTQAFSHFIGERSFNMRGDSSLDFFDECAEKVDENFDTPPLLEFDGPEPNTLFIPPLTCPPSSHGVENIKYTYDKFPDHLNMSLFPIREPPPSPVKSHPFMRIDSKTFLGKRSKTEAKNALKLAAQSKKGIAASALWAKCLLSNAISLWFIHLHSFVSYSSSQQWALRTAFIVLQKMHEYKLPAPDDICYRVMMQLCGILNQPAMAVKVRLEMKRVDHKATAATYGYYNKVVLESIWPRDSSNAKALWRKIRILVTGVAQFRQSLRHRCASQQSLTSGLSVDDNVSRESIESLPLDTTLHNGSHEQQPKKDDRVSNASDRGYSSMSQEDLQNKDRLTPKSSSLKHAQLTNRVNMDSFRNKLGSIIRRSNRHLSPQPDSTNKLGSSAGLLITTSHLRSPNDDLFLNASYHPGLTSKLSDGLSKKRHKSAGDTLKSEEEVLADLELERSPKTSTTTAETKFTTDKSSHNVLPNGNAILEETEASHNKTNSLISSIPSDRCNSEPLGAQALSHDPLEFLNTVSHTQSADPVGVSSQKGDSLGLFSSAQPNNKQIENDTPDPLGVLGSPSKGSSPDGTLLPIQVTLADPLGLFSPSQTSSHRTTTETTSSENIFSSDPSIDQSSSKHSMDIGSLFGRDSSPKKSLSHSSDELSNEKVKKYNLLQLSPEQETQPDVPTLRKSVSLDSRSSYQAALKNSTDPDENEESPDPFESPAVEQETPQHEPTIEVEKSPVQPAPKRGSSYKNWLSSSLKKSTNFAVNSTSKMKRMVSSYGRSQNIQDGPTGSLSSRESIDSIGRAAASRTVSNDPKPSSSINKFKSVSNSMAKQLYHNYNKLKHTVQEYQAPSTVSTPYKDPESLSINEDTVSVHSSDQVLGVNEDQVDDGTLFIDTSIKYGDIPKGFISRYLLKHRTTRFSTLLNEADDSAITQPRVEVVLSSASKCTHCMSVLYDEDIMSGWSATDNEFTVVCRFCDKNFVPTLNVKITAKWFDSTEQNRNELIALDGKRSKAEKQGDIETSVQYLSPLVLRKELENYLEYEGDASLSPDNLKFIDEHPIIFWNMMWFFTRLDVPTHLSQLISQSLWVQTCTGRASGFDPERCRVNIRTVWDNGRVHEMMNSTLYQLHEKPTEARSPTVDALLMEGNDFNQSDIRELLNYIECNDMLAPIKSLLNRRRRENSLSITKHHSLYRDLLFLAFIEFGRNALDHDAFDREYKSSFRRLLASDRQLLSPKDFPPTPKVMWCRKMFSALDIQ